MFADVVGTDSREWREVLVRAEHDVYHLPEYVELAAATDGGRPAAFVAARGEDRLLIPLLIREVPESLEVCGRTLYDASSPYGYSGLLVGDGSGAGATEFVGEALDALRRVLGQNDVVTLFMRLHPSLAQPLEALRERGALVHHGSTVGVDLGIGAAEIRGGMKKKHRRLLAKLEERNHSFQIADSPARIDEFVNLYYENMDRVGAARYYYFTRDYFAQFFASLRGKVHLAILEVEGKTACIDLLTEVHGIIQTHLGATRTEHLPLSPSILLTYRECLWGMERGDRLLHLGGGLGGGEDSLFLFKAGLSGLRFPFHTWRLVVDETAYDQLVRAERPGHDVPEDDITGYFPAYRRPAVR